ncbi:TM2 domain-containing protein [Marinobacter gelidimuriae]|uniref:TM2 domain-containing protein n=1 Tax=Marinobacter gelidimuriae TaxID=2739064 RepID=UPI00037870D3|nr:TM2 domain-containing protein [Marinobacter gelidimuriae]
MQRPDTHSKFFGYLLWIFGFLGAHRFYYGKPITGTIWFFTFGLFLVGVLYDFWTLNTQISERNRGSLLH